MPITIKKVCLNRRDALSATSAILQLTVQVGDIAGFPPIKGAAQILLSILKAIENVDNIEDDRVRLAHRATSLLSAIRQAVESNKNYIPEQLMTCIQSFESVLASINDYVQILSDEKWLSRFLKKSRIDENLRKLNTDLDAAFASFQAWVLISIHASHERMMVAWKPSLTITSSPGEGTPCSHSEVSCSSPALSARVSLECIRDYGFRSYHQSEIVYLNDMYPPLGSEWQYFASADIAGNRTGLVRRYEGSKEAACRAWLQDLKLWRKLHHPHLLQLIGISDEKSALPFLVFANSDLRSLSSHMLLLLKNGSIANCVTDLLHIYNTVYSAAIHVQQQLMLNENQMNNFACTFSLSMNGENNIILSASGEHAIGLCASNFDRIIDLSTIILIRVTPGALFFNRVHISAAGFLETLTKESIFSSVEIADAERLEWRMHHVRTILRTFMPLIGNARLHHFLDTLPTSQAKVLPSTMSTQLQPSLHSLRALPSSNLVLHSPLSSLLTANCWFENSSGTLGDVGFFKRKPGLGLGFIGLENVHGPFMTRYESLRPTLMFDNSQIDGSRFKKCLNLGSSSGIEYGRWELEVPIGGVTHLQLYNHTRLLCPGSLYRMHASYLLQEGPNVAVKHGLSPHQIAILSGNIRCHVYTIKSDTSSSVSSESQCQSYQTVTVFEWPKGGLSFSEPEENEVRDAQLVSTDGSYRLNLRHSHIESEFTILSEEDYAMSDDPPEDGPGSISWEVEQNNRLGLYPDAFYCGLDIAD